MKKAIGVFLGVMMLMSFLAGCVPKKDESKNIDIKEVRDAVAKSLGDEYTPNMELSSEELENVTGIKASDVESYIAETPMISTHVDTFIAIEAKEGKADDIEASLEKYRKYLVEESLQYPMNMAKVNAAKVVRYDDYVFFLMLGRFNEDMDATEEEALAFAKDEIQKVEDIIATFFK